MLFKPWMQQQNKASQHTEQIIDKSQKFRCSISLVLGFHIETNTCFHSFLRNVFQGGWAPGSITQGWLEPQASKSPRSRRLWPEVLEGFKSPFNPWSFKQELNIIVAQKTLTRWENSQHRLHKIPYQNDHPFEYGCQLGYHFCRLVGLEQPLDSEWGIYKKIYINYIIWNIKNYTTF